MKKIICVTEENDDVRIDKYLSEELDELSRNRIQDLIKSSQVFVNEKPVKASYKVSCSDKISIEIPELIEPEIEPENIPLDIVYEDKDIIIVNKPKNMVVHPAPGHYSGTLVNALMYHCKGDLSGINGVLRPGIVHRIDMNTTGLLVVCKNDISHNFVANQLKEHSITRKYHAIVHGNVKEDEFVIDKPIGRCEKDRKKMAVNEKNGKNAITHVKVLKRLEKLTYIECVLETGRTHQIRVHLSSIGHPLLGDLTYSNAGFSKEDSKYEGQCLHAKILGLVHPGTNEYMEFDSELPEYFAKIVL